ncbi:MAG: RnfABCDGE type electron transport complex subunit G [Bacteroidales bacterium]|nr:RnfABCDGE type electron transport complex subunit G [Bacteroidales bacterium]
MATKESSFLNMAITLLVITVLSGITLAYVNQLTLEPKELSKRAKKMDALSEVLPTFDNSPLEDMYKLAIGDTQDSLEFFPAYFQDELVGIAVTSFSTAGYSGDVRLMIGFFPDGTIHKISVLEQKETPGLGTKMTEPKFLHQFYGKNPESYTLNVKKNGGDVDAITAATISSVAFCDAVHLAYNVFINNPDAVTGATEKK